MNLNYIQMIFQSLQGVLRIHVVEAKDLMKKDIGVLGKGKSDPYAIITVGAQQFRTQTIDNTVNPKWDYWCEVVIHHNYTYCELDMIYQFISIVFCCECSNFVHSGDNIVWNFFKVPFEFLFFVKFFFLVQSKRLAYSTIHNKLNCGITSYNLVLKISHDSQTIYFCFLIRAHSRST